MTHIYWLLKTPAIFKEFIEIKKMKSDINDQHQKSVACRFNRSVIKLYIR